MKRIGLFSAAGLVLGLSSGCCWWADRWCPQRHYAPAAYAPAPACYPAPAAPVCCQPCVPCTPTSGYPTTSWSNPGAGTCTPTAPPAAPAR